MRHRKYSLTLTTSVGIGTLAVLLLASCSQGDSLSGGAGAELPAGGAVPLHIVSVGLQSSQEQPTTRTGSATPLTTGSIGVFRSQGAGYAEVQDNRQYTYNITAGWQPHVPDQTVYLMANNADVCAYYPYNAAYIDKTAIPLASGKYKGTADDLTRHDPADICYAEPRTMNGATPSTRLEMNHAMAMVQIRFRRDDLGTTARRLTSVSIGNLKLIQTGTLNINASSYRDDNQSPGGDRSLTWTPGTTEPATGIDLPAAATSEATSALLVPCTLDAAGTTFSFTVDRKSMSVTVPVSLLPAFEAGKIHSLVFDIKANSVSLAQVNILDWWREWDDAGEPDLAGTTKDYIELGGVKWALSNLEYNATYHNYNFAASASAPGSPMQWNALTGTDGNSTATWDPSSDPCSRLEPKGTWVSPTQENFAALAALPHVWQQEYGTPAGGMNGVWFGTADIHEAKRFPNRYLFLSIANTTEYAYWSKSYSAADTNPMAFLISSGTPMIVVGPYSTSGLIRCVKPGI